jgi:pimeloyl-ACP methyl ester carboxylesterase
VAEAGTGTSGRFPMHNAGAGPDLVSLPATRREDTRFGTIPSQVAGFSAARVHQVRFPAMVWYSKPVREQAIRQIRALATRPVVLIGFSKSGLGAWNITVEAPELVAATVIFDAPVACETPPRWDLSPYYAGREEWLADLPIRRVGEYRRAVPLGHRLILISGEKFHDEMAALSQALRGSGVAHTFLPGRRREHHWQSGWIGEALEVLSAGPGAGRARRGDRLAELPRTHRRRIRG